MNIESQPQLRPHLHWAIRAAFVIVHISLLFGLVAITPAEFARKLGYYTGLLMVGGSIGLWIALFSGRTHRRLVWVFSLAVVQLSIIAAVVSQFRAEDGLLQEIMAAAQRQQKEGQTQFESLHLDRLFEMLTPPQTLRAEELPALLDRVRQARRQAADSRVKTEDWVQASEARITKVSRQAAVEFRRGVNIARPGREQANAALDEYLAEYEGLVEFLIAAGGHYDHDKHGIRFDRQADWDRYRRMLDKLAASEQQLAAYREKILER